MLTATGNNLKSVTLLIKERDLAPVKSILKFLTEKFPRFSVKKFSTGKIGENILVSFRVSDEFYPKVLEKFAYNDIPLIMKDKSVLKFIDEKKEQKRRTLRAQGWSEITVSKHQISLSQLASLSEQGKVKEVAKEAKGGVRSSIKIVNRAKELLTKTILIAIENLLKYAEERVGKIQEAIDQLLLIATDKELKLFHKNEEMNKAGLAAIDLSIKHKNYHKNLIRIANNTKLNNLTNIKAIITFAKLYPELSDKDTKRMPEVMKQLNTRWLYIAFETVKKTLSSEDIEIFHNFTNMIIEKRKAS